MDSEVSSPILNVSGLKLVLGSFFSQRAEPILDGVDLKLNAGRSLAVLGGTGSGKSLLLRAITRYFHGLPVRSVEGKVEFEGKDLLRCSQGQLFALRGSKIAYLLQNAHALFNPQLTIRQHFELLLRFNRPDLTDRPAHATRCLYQVGIVDPERMLEHRCYPDELDTATRQKIMIASALCGEPKVLLADEPTAEFDSSTVTLLLGLFEKLKKERGLAILMATGRVRRAEQFGDEIAVLDRGKIVQTSTPREVFRGGKKPPAVRLFAEGTLRAGVERQRLISPPRD